VYSGIIEIDAAGVLEQARPERDLDVARGERVLAGPPRSYGEAPAADGVREDLRTGIDDRFEFRSHDPLYWRHRAHPEHTRQ
jgi:hypothetical protein